MDNIQIKAEIVHNKSIIISLGNWQLLAKGEGHFILSNKAPHDELFHYVLSVCRHQIDSLPRQFQVIYEKVLSGMKRIETYLLKREQVVFQQKEKDKFQQMLDAICPSKLLKFRVFISKNLVNEDQKWDFYLQFKPKTPLPDFYSEEFISNFCQNNKFDKDQLLKLLDKSPPRQKLRWFKKNALNNNKKNMNSLDIFGFFNSNVPNYQKIVKSLTDKEIVNNLNINLLIAEFLKQTKLFEDILRLQMLHLSSNDFRWVDIERLTDYVLEDSQIWRSFLQEVYTIQSPLLMGEELHKEPVCKCGSVGQKKTDFEKILRFLISWSWRDVSVIVRFNLSKQLTKFQQVDLKVIDYELKQAKKLHSILKKDEQFLLNYLQLKRNQ